VEIFIPNLWDFTSKHQNYTRQNSNQLRLESPKIESKFKGKKGGEENKNKKKQLNTNLLHCSTLILLHIAASYQALHCFH